MTTERQDKICKACVHFPDCGYISRNLQRKCTILQDYDDGYNMGWEDAVNKACEWFKEIACCNYIEDIEVGEFIEKFCKAMDE